MTLFVLACVLLVAPAAASARDFPRDFQWGVAIAGFQTEYGQGRNVDAGSDWWAWTHDAGNIADGTVTADKPEQGPGFLAKYRKDIHLAADRLNLKAFRMSIEWSRVFPRSTAGVTGLKALDRLANKKAIRRYRGILRRIHAEGMTPWVTVNHFALPSWVHDPIHARDVLDANGPHADPPAFERSGWLDPGTVTEFRKYAAYLAWKLGPEVGRWITLNEPMVVAVNGYANIPGLAQGNFPPGSWSYPGVIRAVLNMADANAAAYDAIHKQDRRAKVGFVHNMVAFTPSDPNSPDDVRGAEHARYLFDQLFMDAAVRGLRDRNVNGIIEQGERIPGLANKADFVGLNYYFRGRVTGLPAPLTSKIPLLDFVPNTQYQSPAAPSASPCPTTCTEFGWEIYPEGFRQVLALAGSYRKPVIVTENGISDSNDDQRASYLTSHLEAMRQAMAAKEADVRGYFHWSLVDNFEWAVGYSQHFGLFSFDPVTLRRTERPSARVYARIAKTGELP
jgi:beta-glucosidase/6-phospho-beta-glucosidase/beta-galactosidase